MTRLARHPDPGAIRAPGSHLGPEHAPAFPQGGEPGGGHHVQWKRGGDRESIDMLGRWLTFGSSAEQEDRFRQASLRSDVAQARICISLVLVALLAFALNDYQ